MAGLSTLFFYVLAANVAIAVLPHEPAVIAGGAEYGVWLCAVVGTLATVAAGVVDILLFQPALSRRGPKLSGLGRTLLTGFGRAPFWILVAASLTPLPFWPFKAAAFASGMSRLRYLLALFVGRLPRHLLLAWLGHSIDLPTSWIVLASAALAGVMLLMGRLSGNSDSKPNLQPSLPTSETTESVMNEETKAVRTTKSLTHAWEQRNLPKMARALPAWVTPDHMTALGVFAALIIGAGFVLSNISEFWLLAVIPGLLLHWAGDSLDGTLARVRKMERENYGYFVDRTADAISVVLMGVGFGLSPYVQLPLAMLLTMGYLLIMLYAEICAYTTRTFPLSVGHFGPTEVRIFIGLASLALFFFQPVTQIWMGIEMSVVDVGVVAGSAGLFTAFLASSAKQAIALDIADRKKWVSKDSDRRISSGTITVVADSGLTLQITDED